MSTVLAVRPAAAAVLLAACGGPDEDYQHVPVLDVATFVADVQPVLQDRCANPSCHGRPERPLAVYAPRRWRADPARLFLDEPLTPAELRRNYQRACGFAVGAGEPDHSLLLRKPIGDAYHGGGVVLDRYEPDAETIRAWLWTAW